MSESPPSRKPPSVQLDRDGRERPAFLLNFPQHPELDRLVAAYERGDFRYVRNHAEQVAQQADDPQVQAAARELRRRIDPDPLLVGMLAIAAALFVFLVVWAYW